MEIRSRQEKTHTPGPWKYDWAPKGDNIISIYHTDNDSGYVRYICDTIGTDTPLIPENDSNARLIAAAPDMAQALGELIAEFEREADENLERAMGPMICAYSYEDTIGISFARAALKKAGV